MDDRNFIWTINKYGTPKRIKIPDEIAFQRLPGNLMPIKVPSKIVCGAAGSGKSTYVDNLKAPGDMVIDFDAIQSNISGNSIHDTNDLYLKKTLKKRNNLLVDAARLRCNMVFFIIACPDIMERKWWARALGAEIVLMSTSAKECKKRIRSDPSRSKFIGRMCASVDRWFAIDAASRDLDSAYNHIGA